MENIVLAGGCFWCLQAVYEMLHGVQDVVCVYAGGSEDTARYELIHSGDTDHIESVSISYDPDVITLTDLLDVFWIIHNPTTPNRQGYDVGSQYRSAIFYSNSDQKQVAETSLAQAQKLWTEPIVTELIPLQAFYAAEDYHQHYFAKNPKQGYCQVIINPKLELLRQKFKSLVK